MIRLDPIGSERISTRASTTVNPLERSPQLPLIEACQLSKKFRIRPSAIQIPPLIHTSSRADKNTDFSSKRAPSFIQAVDAVSLTINKGETFGLVGASGSGKTTLGRLLLNLYQPDGGQVLYRGRAITSWDRKMLRKQLQVVFQNPYSSLDPRMNVLDIIGEPLDIHRLVEGKADRKDRVSELLEMIGLSSWYLERFPHELSGGQRQRIAIARALAAEPELLVCDEPVSALDISVQAQIINLFLDLQSRLQLTCLFISHDLNMVRHVSDRIGVMVQGQLVENRPAAGLFSDPQHPYTIELMSAATVKRNRPIAKGEIV